MIAADTLVVVGGLVLVEGIGGKVQHTVVQSLVAQDKLVGLCHLLGSVALHLVHEHIVVEVTLVHHPHIHKTQHGDTGNHELGTQFLVLIEHEEGEAGEDDPERAPAISCEDALANLGEVAHDGPHILIGQLLQSLCLLHGDEVGEEQAGHEGEEQTEACRQSQAGIDPFCLFGQYLRFIHNLLQRHHRQQRDGKLGDDENGSHRSELGVHRDVVEEEIGEGHEVPAP